MTRILVVDDHEIVRKRICTILSAEQELDVCGEAVDGRDALEKAKELKPDVVVMDVSMPNMNGIEATKKIHDVLPETRIIVISQHENPDMSRHALAAGAHAYVSKSVIPANLVPTINSLARDPAERPGIEAPKLAVKSGALREAQTRESEKSPDVQHDRDDYFFSVMNTVAEGLITADSNGIFTYLNPAGEALLGWSAGELSGKRVHDSVHHSRLDGRPYPTEECPVTKVLEKGVQIHEHEDVFIRKDGSFLPVVFSASPLRSRGEVSGVVIAFRDDTKRRQAGAAMQLSIRTLEARVSERTAALDSATHELRELSGKLLNAQDEERRRIARELHDGVGQLLAALSMNLSMVTNEKAKLGMEARSSLEESGNLVDQASREIRTLSHLLHPPLLDEVGLESALRWYVTGFAERSKIAVEMQLASNFGENLPRDLSLALFRIVQESLTNVHRHSGSNTALVIVERAAHDIALTVKDVGTGISADTQAKITSGEGSGVGLRGIRERIRQFGGRLELQSDADGTQVKAVLPIQQISAQENSGGWGSDILDLNVPGPANQETRSLATILCIDDEPAGLLPRKLMLESAGYRVVEARSGPEGIELFKTIRADIVLLDYWMSGMKGTAVASELKRINPNVRIIVLSGMLDLPGEATGVIDKWIVKGSTRAEQLLESISSLLERRVS